MNNENKHLKLHIDAAIEYRNKNVYGDMDRKKLGRLLFPEHSESNITTIMTRWNSGTLYPNPEPMQLVNMANILGVSVDFILGVTDIPEPMPNLPARMLTVLFVAENELREHRNTDESEALKAIEELKNKLV